MADKRIFELATTTDRVDKYFVLDKAATAAAEKFAADDLLSEADAATVYLTQASAVATYLTIAAAATTYVSLTGGQTISGLKLFTSPFGIQIIDVNTSINRDGSNNLTLKDAVTGTKTLAELAATLSLGTSGQIPRMNPGGTDFVYSSDLSYNGTVFYIQADQPLQAQTDRAHSAWVDFPTSAPTRRSGIFATPTGLGGLDGYNAVAIAARNAADDLAYSYLATRSISGSDNSAMFAVCLSGTSSSDWRTPMKMAFDGRVWWQVELTSQDITHYWVQGTTTQVVTGWDDSKAAFQISLGTGFDAANRFEVDSNWCRWYGDATAGMLIKAASGANNARLQLDAGSTGDCLIEFLDGGIFRQLIGYDESASSIVIAAGTTITTASRYSFQSQNPTFYGSAAMTFTLDAATSSCSINIQANSTGDSTIRFRQDTTSRFIIGYDDSADMFQIHSSSSYSSSADFQVNTSGRIGLGVAPHANDQIYLYKNNTSGTHYAMRLYMDGNSDLYRGIWIQCGLDTLTAADNTYLWCADGNGTTVGTLLADTTSFRLYNAVSSRDYKADIVDMAADTVAKFRNPKSHPKNYRYIGRTQREKDDIEARGINKETLVGFIIEDLVEEFPDAVKQIDDGTGKLVPMYAEAALVPYIVKALIELDARLQLIEP